jgi:predicted HTH transcriptional regulator
MSIESSQEYLRGLLRELQALSNETEWVEFKHNNAEPEEIGEYISALSNSAALEGKVNGYIIWGIDNNTHEVIGTNFNPKHSKKGNESFAFMILQSRRVEL